MYKKLLALSVLTLSFNMAQSNIAFAHHGHHCNIQKVLKGLDLNNDQKAKIKEIIEKADQSVMNDRAALKDIRKQANEEFVANTMDDSKIDKIVDKKLPLIGSIMKQKMKERLEISQVLTDAQKAKLAQMMAKEKSKEHEDEQE